VRLYAARAVSKFENIQREFVSFNLKGSPSTQLHSRRGFGPLA